MMHKRVQDDYEVRCSSYNLLCIISFYLSLCQEMIVYCYYSAVLLTMKCELG